MDANKVMEATTEPDDTNKRFVPGVKVSTCLGEGEVVGKESLNSGKLVRYLVRLKVPSRWAFGKKTDVACFFKHELVAI